MNALVPKIYPLLVAAVEDGAAYGFHRAYKYTEHPTEDAIIDAITEAVVNSIFERFEIPERTDGALYPSGDTHTTP